MNIEAVICDMDGTLVTYDNEPFHSSWDAMAQCLPDEKRQRWFFLRDSYYGKEKSYEQWFHRQVALLQGVKLEEARKALFPVPYSPGVRNFFAQNNSFKKGILTAGLALIAEEIASELGFDGYIAQSLEIKNSIFTGHGTLMLNLGRKAEGLSKLAKRLDIRLQNSSYVGDTISDASCMEKVKFPVAFNPKPDLAEYARAKKIPIINNFMQLGEVLSLR